MDDAVVVENGEKSHVGIEGEAEDFLGLEGQNGNRMSKILHPRNGMKEEEQQEKENDGEVFEVLVKELVIDEGTDCSHETDEPEDYEEDWCDACRVDFDDRGKEIEIDRDTFWSLLHRVSLEQAKRYAKMARLGNLAYAISEIKVDLFHFLWSIRVMRMKIFSCLLRI